MNMTAIIIVGCLLSKKKRTRKILRFYFIFFKIIILKLKPFRRDWDHVRSFIKTGDFYFDIFLFGLAHQTAQKLTLVKCLIYL